MYTDKQKAPEKSRSYTIVSVTDEQLRLTLVVSPLDCQPNSVDSFFEVPWVGTVHVLISWRLKAEWKTDGGRGVGVGAWVRCENICKNLPVFWLHIWYGVISVPVVGVRLCKA